MTQITDATYANGVLRPDRSLDLRENQRVRVVVEPLDDQQQDRAAALARLKAGIGSMQFFSNGRIQSRDQSHEPLSSPKVVNRFE
jgi:predicted DNA-binding antitoxin AbrB/MazE fold protein